jgi:hypothetical protein
VGTRAEDKYAARHCRDLARICTYYPGAPTASLLTTKNNSLVIGVGNDWDNAISRTVGANQALVHQYLPSIGDTYWVQRVTTLSAAGTIVTINDIAPTTDRYNLSICEIVGP